MDSAHLPPDRLGDYAEGLLDPAARRAADAHLEACGECRRALAATREYFAEMAGLEPFRAPDRFLTRVHDRIARRSPWKRALAVLSSPRFLPVPLAGMAAVLVGVYLVLAPQLRQEAPHAVALAEPPSAVQEMRAPEKRSSAGAAPRAAPEKPGLAEAGARTEAEPFPDAEPPVVALAERKAAADEGGRDSRARAGSAAKAKAPAAPMAQPAAPLTTGSAERMASGPRVESEALADAAVSDEAAPLEKVLDDFAEESGGLPSESDGDREVLAFNRRAVPAGKKAEAQKAEAQKAEAGKAEIPPPASTPMPWAPEDYTLRRKAGGGGAAAKAGSGTAADGLGGGLANLGARILRFEGGATGRYELELPADRLPELEAYLRGHGDLIPSSRPRPDRASGGSLRLVLRVERAPAPPR